MPDSLDAPADKSEGNPIIPTLGQLRIAWENEEYDDYYQLLMQFGTILEFLNKKREKGVAGKLAVYNARSNELGNEFDTHQSVNQELFILHSLSPYHINSLFVGSNIDDVVNNYHDELVSLSTIHEGGGRLPWSVIGAMAEGRFVKDPTSDKGDNGIKH